MSISKKREKYIKQRFKDLVKMGVDEKKLMGRAKDISSFWKNKRNYDIFLKRAKALAKERRTEIKAIAISRKTLKERIETKASMDIAKIDTSKIVPVKGQKGAVFSEDYVERFEKAKIRANAYIEELSKLDYDEDVKEYLETQSSVLEMNTDNLKDYDYKHARFRLAILEKYDLDIVEKTIEADRKFLINIFTGGKMATINQALKDELIATINATTVKQLNALYERYSREKIIEDYQDWRMLDTPLYSKSDLETKARWFIGKLKGE